MHKQSLTHQRQIRVLTYAYCSQCLNRRTLDFKQFG